MARRVAPKGLRRRTPLETVGENPSEFGADELGVLTDVIPVAEELVGDRYQLTSFGPIHRCYEVLTFCSAGADGKAEQALAKLSRYDRRERPIEEGSKVSRFYSICLQDDNLLERAREGFQLRALLLYVLTHELLHIVRFESFQVSYNASASAREREEHIIDALTREVLEELRDVDIDAVLNGLSQGRVDVLVTQE